MVLLSHVHPQMHVKCIVPAGADGPGSGSDRSEPQVNKPFSLRDGAGRATDRWRPVTGAVAALPRRSHRKRHRGTAPKPVRPLTFCGSACTRSLTPQAMTRPTPWPSDRWSLSGTSLPRTCIVRIVGRPRRTKRLVGARLRRSRCGDTLVEQRAPVCDMRFQGFALRVLGGRSSISGAGRAPNSSAFN
jgi:hypothetical protein